MVYGDFKHYIIYLKDKLVYKFLISRIIANSQIFQPISKFMGLDYDKRYETNEILPLPICIDKPFPKTENKNLHFKLIYMKDSFFK